MKNYTTWFNLYGDDEERKTLFEKIESWVNNHSLHIIKRLKNTFRVKISAAEEELFKNFMVYLNQLKAEEWDFGFQVYLGTRRFKV